MGFRRIFSGLLSFIFAMHFMLAGWPGTALINEAFADDTASTSCDTGMVYNSLLNRCLSSEQAARVKAASATCESQADAAAKKQCYVAAAEGQLNDAQASGQVKSAGKVSTNTMSVILAMGGLLASVNWLALGGPSKCGAASTSAWIIAGGSAAVVAGEVMSGMQYKSKMKKANEALQKISEGSDATNYQADAFDALIKREEAVISAAKTKKALYMVATAAYAAAAVMAVIEIATQSASMGMGTAAVTCTPVGLVHQSQDAMIAQYLDNYFLKNKKQPYQAKLSINQLEQTESLADLFATSLDQRHFVEGSNQSITTEEYQVLHDSFAEIDKNIDQKSFSILKTAMSLAGDALFPSAHAQDATTPVAAGAMAGAAPAAAGAVASTGTAAASAAGTASNSFMAGLGQLGSAAMKASQGLNKLFVMPVTRLALSAVLMVNSAFMMGHIGKEEQKAQSRKTFLEQLKVQVTAAGTSLACAAADTTDPSKPVCYCLSSDGSANPARSNSTVCKNYLLTNPVMAKTAYTTSTPIASTQSTCISKTGAVDTSCACVSTSSCLSISPSLIGQVPSAISLGDIPSTVDGLNGGKLSAASINTELMNAAATKMQKTLDTLVNNPKNANLKDAKKQADALAQKTTDDLSRSLASSPGLAGLGSGSTTGSDLLSASTPAQALEKMRDELKQEVNAINTGAPAGGSGASASGKMDVGLDFSGLGDLNKGGVKIDDEKLAELVDKNLATGNSDINTEASGDIFLILSNRYRTSGMRRLFSDDKEMVTAPWDKDKK